MSSPNVGGPDP